MKSKSAKRNYVLDVRYKTLNTEINTFTCVLWPYLFYRTDVMYLDSCKGVTLSPLYPSSDVLN